MKIKKTLIFLLAMLQLFCSCNAPDAKIESTPVTTTSTTEPPKPVFPADSLFEEPKPNEEFLAIKTRYTDEELKKIQYFKGTLDELKKNFPFEYCKYNDEGIGIVSYFSKDGTACVSIYFNESIGKIIGTWFDYISCSVYDLATIKKGMTLVDVKQIDPMGTYYPIVGSGSDKTSRHITPEGYAVTVFYEYVRNPDVSYKESHIVVDVQCHDILA